MKRNLKITAFLLFCTLSLHAQVDTKGTDFWLTFAQNTMYTSASVSLQIRIVGSDQPATGTIYFTNINASVTFTVAAGGVFTHNLTSTQITAVYNTTAGTNNRSAHITSSSPVTAYAINQAAMSADATNILPITALGTDYYQISYMPRNTGNNEVDAYAVVATANNTVINHNGSPVATINTGQVYYFRTAALSIDMTGARITSDKPVAFFVVNQAAFVPDGYTGGDILFQQLAPVNTWGKNFFVPVSHLGKDRIRNDGLTCHSEQREESAAIVNRCLATLDMTFA